MAAAAVRDRVGRSLRSLARGHAFQGARVEGRQTEDGACHVVGDETSIPVLARSLKDLNKGSLLFPKFKFSAKLLCLLIN